MKNISLKGITISIIVYFIFNRIFFAPENWGCDYILHSSLIFVLILAPYNFYLVFKDVLYNESKNIWKTYVLGGLTFCLYLADDMLFSNALNVEKIITSILIAAIAVFVYKLAKLVYQSSR